MSGVVSARRLSAIRTSAVADAAAGGDGASSGFRSGASAGFRSGALNGFRSGFAQCSALQSCPRMGAVASSCGGSLSRKRPPNRWLFLHAVRAELEGDPRCELDPKDRVPRCHGGPVLPESASSVLEEWRETARGGAIDTALREWVAQGGNGSAGRRLSCSTNL